MTTFSFLNKWLDIRPSETRPLLLATAGAFFLLAFMVLTRSLRESLFLATYDIEKLPLMMGTVVLFSLPAVGQFSRLLTNHQPRKILTGLTVIQMVGLVVLWRLLPVADWAIQGIYLWTAVGSLLMASGFWMVVAELFPLRGAKRLFSLISAGGTLGAMFSGLSLSWFSGHFGLSWLVLLSVVPSLVFLLMINLMPKGNSETGPKLQAGSKFPIIEAARAAWHSRHLSLMSGIIFTASLVMTLVDFQFKEMAQAHFSDGPHLAGFLGSFYGWAGLAALLVQVFLAGNLIEKRGVAFSLSLPAIVLIVGGFALLFFPSLFVVTALRGADYVLRKSLFRPTMEVLFVSVPTRFRRLTKTFIDSVVDSAAEGFGALIILLWLTVFKLPVAGLSILIVIFAAVYFGLSRLINNSYFRTITRRLQEEVSRTQQPDSNGLYLTGNLLRATFTNLDLSELQHLDDEQDREKDLPPSDETSVSQDRILEDLESPDDRVVLRALAGIDIRDPDNMALLTRLIARDSLFQKVAALLQRYPRNSVPPLVTLLSSRNTDFVIRRRIPEVLAHIGGEEADDALLDALSDRRFEVRYRSAVALLARRTRKLPCSNRDWRLLIWHTISLEVRKDRPLWELHKLLDDFEVNEDDFIHARVGVRGELSLEHTFRLLSLVLDPVQVRAAYHGVIFDDPGLKSFALEYLELVLPSSVRQRLWFYIGDVSEKRKQEQARPLDHVVADMMVTGQTLFGGEITRQALKKMVAQKKPGSTDEEDGS